MYNYRVGHESFSTNYKNVNVVKKISINPKRKILEYIILEENLKEFFDYAIFYYTLLILIVAMNFNNKNIYEKYKLELKMENI